MVHLSLCCSIRTRRAKRSGSRFSTIRFMALKSLLCCELRARRRVRRRSVRMQVESQSLWRKLQPVRVGKRAGFVCQCACGTIRTVLDQNLKNGRSRSCGCDSERKRLIHATKHGASKRKQRTKEYRAWVAMNQRCYNPKTHCFADYGGRGITVCEDWRGRGGFENFIAAIGEAPAKHLTLERKDNMAGYSPQNCTWATRVEQARNSRPKKKRRPRVPQVASAHPSF